MGRILMWRLKDIIKNAYILPIYTIIAADTAWTWFFIYHGITNPDISFKRPYFEPFEAYRNKPYKLWMSDEYRDGYHCKAPTGPCYLTPEEEEQQKQQPDQGGDTKDEEA